MSNSPTHNEAVSAMNSGNLAIAEELFSHCLYSYESTELWNDWAYLQLLMNRPAEAEEGFLRAIDLDVNNGTALTNLGVLLVSRGQGDQAYPYLLRAMPLLKNDERAVVEKTLNIGLANRSTLSSQAEAVLRSLTSSDVDKQYYLSTHLQRFISTLDLLPQAQSGDKLLELGAAHHHLSAAVKELKGYDVLCTDFWEGVAERVRVGKIATIDGSKTYEFEVKNFDVEREVWPYEENSINVVLLCEVLEHLAYDPMMVLAESNRVLRAGGMLLLTTPNVASTHGLRKLIDGEGPYTWAKFCGGGRATDHHNREYTCNELERLLAYAGFTVERIFTRYSWASPDRSLLRFVAGRRRPISRMGENIFCLARNTGTVTQRYPADFYEGVSKELLEKNA